MISTHRKALVAGRSERGWVIVVAFFVLFMMLLFGLALLKIFDTQAKTSGGERTSESALNLAEGLLNAEAVILQSNWPTQTPCATVAAGCGYFPPNSNAIWPAG